LKNIESGIVVAYGEDDRTLETSVQLQQAQGTLPSAFGTAIFHLVDMLEDEDIIENGAIGMLEETWILDRTFM
jgi:hypothetical protein